MLLGWSKVMNCLDKLKGSGWLGFVLFVVFELCSVFWVHKVLTFAWLIVE
jgi:hypothetical protein